MIETIIIFIIILAILILSHEFGHFISAKKMGMKVEEFGFGFPPRLFGIKKGETLYSFNLIPLGGFVKIFGEQKPENKKEGPVKKISQKLKKRAFYNKPIWQRAIVLVMGVTMNLLVAVALLSIVHAIGVPTAVNSQAEAAELQAANVQVQILQINSDSPAQQAGLRAGDVIIKIKAKNSTTEINQVEDVQKTIARYAGEEVNLVIKRGEEIIEKTVIPRVSPPENQGPLGITVSNVGIVKYPWYSAIIQGFKTTGELLITFVGLFYELFKTLITSGTLMGGVAGPVGIAVLTSQVSKLGIIYLLQFVALISINLAIINILPFPALDGGRLMFLGIEKIKGSPVNAKIENAVNALGFILLIGLMVLVTFRDVSRLF